MQNQVVNRSHLGLQAVQHCECYESLEPTIGTSLGLDAQFIIVVIGVLIGILWMIIHENPQDWVELGSTTLYNYQPTWVLKTAHGDF